MLPKFSTFSESNFLDVYAVVHYISLRDLESIITLTVGTEKILGTIDNHMHVSQSLFHLGRWHI